MILVIWYFAHITGISGQVPTISTPLSLVWSFVVSSSTIHTGYIFFDGLLGSVFAFSISVRIILAALPAPTIRVRSYTSLCPTSTSSKNVFLKINLNSIIPNVATIKYRSTKIFRGDMFIMVSTAKPITKPAAIANPHAR